MLVGDAPDRSDQRRIRVGLNILFIKPAKLGGSAAYARGLIEALPSAAPEFEFVVFCSRDNASWPLPDAPTIIRVVCPTPSASVARRYLYEQTRFQRLVYKSGVDLLHSLGYVTPLWCHVPSIVSIYDLNFTRIGAQMSPQRRLALNFFVRASAMRSRRIITISEFSKSELVNHLHIRPSKIDVTHLAPSRASNSLRKALQTSMYGLTGPYVVAFSSGSGHKNIDRLVEAMRLARSKYQLHHQLLVIGHRPDHRMPETQEFRFTGFIEDEERDRLVAGADLLAFPSMYEGFGLPVLDAMATGVPVAASNRAAIPEIGGTAAAYFDPENIDEMASVIARIAANPALRADLLSRGLANSKRYSWAATAKATVLSYLRALGTV